MSEPFLGEIRILPYTFAPLGWLACDGSLLSISQYDTLFSLIGTIYGGDGENTFALPDLRGRAGVHQGPGPGISVREIGQRAGSETVALTTGNLPPHVHAVACSTNDSNLGTPQNNVPSNVANGYAAAVDARMSPTMLGATGSSQSVPIEFPFLATTPCMAVEGIYPTRS